MSLARFDIRFPIALFVSLACALATPAAYADGGPPAAPTLEQEAQAGAAGVGDPVAMAMEAAAVEQSPVAQQPAAVEAPTVAPVQPVAEAQTPEEQPAAAEPPTASVEPAPEEPVAEDHGVAEPPALEQPAAADTPAAATQPAAEVPEKDLGAPAADPVAEIPAPTGGGGNINVVIRILSPGDDGPVQQITDGVGGRAGTGLDWNWHWTWDWTCAPTTAAWDWNWNWTECAGGLTPKAPGPQTRLPIEQSMPTGEALDAWQVGAISAPLPGARERSAGGDPSAGGVGRRPAGSHGREPHGDGDPPMGGFPPVGVGTESLVPVAQTPAAGTTNPAARADAHPARKDGGRDHRRHDPAPPAPGPAATASTGGGGIGSVLLAAVLAGLLALAPRPARAALTKRRAPKTSLGSSRPERPG